MKEEEIKRMVRQEYARLVKGKSPCCSFIPSKDIGTKIGYSERELQAMPEGANLILGCGNPVALSSLREGETVLDLGSGTGLDCLLAAQRVGERGRVIGVDMTEEMVEKARENAQKGGYRNVEFRQGEIEDLPVEDASVDVVISNCVINLCPHKERAFREAFRVLRPGGRMIISDLVLLKELPAPLKDSTEAYIGCIAGASKKDEYLETIRGAGFQGVRIIEETPFLAEVLSTDPLAQSIGQGLCLSAKEWREILDSLISIRVIGVKPKGETLD